MMYHPIAHTFLKSIESNVKRYTKDLFEIQNLQSSEGRSEKFAMVSVNTFKNGVLSQVLDLNPNAEICVSSVLSDSLECIQKPENHNMSIIFNPIDGFVNFTRGFDAFAISVMAFNAKKEFQFSLIYDFKTHAVAYSDADGIASVNGKKLEFVERKRAQNAIVARNSASDIDVSKYLAAVSTNSISHDFINLASGRIDGISYKKIKSFYALPAILIAKNAGFEHLPMKNVSLDSYIDPFIFTNSSII